MTLETVERLGFVQEQCRVKGRSNVLLVEDTSSARCSSSPLTLGSPVCQSVIGCAKERVPVMKRESWEQLGCKDTTRRAREIAKKITSEHKPEPFA